MRVQRWLSSKESEHKTETNVFNCFLDPTMFGFKCAVCCAEKQLHTKFGEGGTCVELGNVTPLDYKSMNATGGSVANKGMFSKSSEGYPLDFLLLSCHWLGSSLCAQQQGICLQ